MEIYHQLICLNESINNQFISLCARLCPTGNKTNSLASRSCPMTVNTAGCPHSALLFSTVTEVLPSTIGKKQNKGMQTVTHKKQNCKHKNLMESELASAFSKVRMSA